LMVPMLARTTEEMVRLVPHSLRGAAPAPGYPRWGTPPRGGAGPRPPRVPALAHVAADRRAHGPRRDRHRVARGDRAHRWRDGAPALHGARQSEFLDPRSRADAGAVPANLSVRDRTVR